MGRRGRSTTIGKFAKLHHDRRVSEIRMLGEQLRRELETAAIVRPIRDPPPAEATLSRTNG